MRTRGGRLSLRCSATRRRLARRALHRNRFPARFHDPLPPLSHQLSVARARPDAGAAFRMKFPLSSTVSIGKYVAAQQRKGQRYPLVLMLEPTLACNIACIGCGKIREYESNRARLTTEECLDAGLQCPAPVVSICGGEPLVYKGIEEVVPQVLELGKTIELCTNALRLEQCLDWFEPSNRLSFVIHLDGMRESHDYVCASPGLGAIAGAA